MYQFSCRVIFEGRMFCVSAVRKLNLAAQLSSNQAYANFRIGTPSSSGVLNSLVAGQPLISDVADVRISVFRAIRSHAQQCRNCCDFTHKKSMYYSCRLRGLNQGPGASIKGS